MTKKRQTADINTWLAGALAIVLLLGTYYTFAQQQAAPTGPAQLAEKAEVTLTYLGADCEDCFDITVATDALEQELTIKEVKELSIEDSKELAEQHGITKLPAMVLTGNLEGVEIAGFEQKDGALVFTEVPPPYYDLETETVEGTITFTILDDATCAECQDLSVIADQLKQAGVTVQETVTVDLDSEEGQALVEQYQITKVPTILLSEGAKAYAQVSQAWSDVGTEEEDGTLVLRDVQPPYRNLETGDVEGLVTITHLADKRCTSCFDPAELQTVLEQSFGMGFSAVETLDIASTEGKKLVEEYDIALIPTVVLSDDAGLYPSFAETWAQVGKQSGDLYVFTEIGMLESYFQQAKQQDSFVYKNLTSGKEVNSTN